MMTSSPLVTVGIDVGGERKGFHAVALRAGAYLAQTETRSAGDLREWCLSLQAGVVAVDAPCRWSAPGAGRHAEQELRRARIGIFATPTRAAAARTPFYHWMLQGEAVFAALQPAYPLFDGGGAARFCCETFPHAAACLLAGRPLLARDKREDRHSLLRAAGVETAALKSIDLLDAALCAYVAHLAACGKTRAYGDAAGGFIVLPAGPLPSVA